jgi:hypothetical protein
MKQRTDAILAGTYMPPASVNMLTVGDWGYEEDNAVVYLQQTEQESVPYTVFNQAIERMRQDNLGAMNNMTHNIVNSLRNQYPAPSSPQVQPQYASAFPPRAPPPSHDPNAPMTGAEMREMFMLLNQTLSQFQLQTRKTRGQDSQESQDAQQGFQ